MGLKTYSLRLDEEEFEKPRKALGDYGDPDLNVGYVIRACIRDLNRAIPNLKKSEYGLRNNLAFYGSIMKHIDRLVNVEIMLKGEGKKLWKKIEEEKQSGSYIGDEGETPHDKPASSPQANRSVIQKKRGYRKYLI